MEIIIEEISRGQKLISRHKFAKSEINIGRGYHNDIILSDPHVCADHICLSFNGDMWTVNDIDSVNGSFLDETKDKAHGHQLKSGDIITLGKSQVRIIFPHHPVPESIAIGPIENLLNVAKHPVFIAINVLVFASIIASLHYINIPKEVHLTQLLEPTIKLLILAVTWPLFVSLISHLMKNDARVLTQISVTFLSLNVLLLGDFIETFVNFNTSSQMPLRYLVLIFPVAVLFTLFWLNTFIGFHTSAKRRYITAAALTLLLVGGSFANSQNKKQKQDFVKKPSYDSTIMSPTFQFSNTETVDKFVKDSDRLFDQVKEEAKKKPDNE